MTVIQNKKPPFPNPEVVYTKEVFEAEGYIDGFRLDKQPYHITIEASGMSVLYTIMSFWRGVNEGDRKRLFFNRENFVYEINFYEWSKDLDFLKEEDNIPCKLLISSNAFHEEGLLLSSFWEKTNHAFKDSKRKYSKENGHEVLTYRLTFFGGELVDKIKNFLQYLYHHRFLNYYKFVDKDFTENTQLFEDIQNNIPKIPFTSTQLVISESMIQQVQTAFQQFLPHSYELNEILRSLKKEVRKAYLQTLNQLETQLQNIPNPIRSRILNIYVQLWGICIDKIPCYQTKNQVFTWNISIFKENDTFIIRYQNIIEQNFSENQTIITYLNAINPLNIATRQSTFISMISHTSLCPNWWQEMKESLAKISCYADKIAYQSEPLDDKAYFTTFLMKIRN